MIEKTSHAELCSGGGETPWLKEKRWRGGRVIDGMANDAMMAGAFAILFGAAAVVIDVGVWRHQEWRRDFPMLLAVLFSLAAAVMIYQALRKTAVWMRYGHSILESVTFPGVVGGQLVGIIYTKTKLRPEDGFHLHLACVNRVWTKWGNENRRSDTVIWHAEEHLVRGAADDDPTRSAIPVGFRIPRDCRPTESADVNDQIFWKLTVSAKTPGVDYEVNFEVPVFVTAESDLQRETIDPVAAYRAAAIDKQNVSQRRVYYWVDVRGAAHVRFGRWRNVGMNAMWIGFGVLMLMVVVFLWRDASHDLFSRLVITVMSAGFGLFGALLLMIGVGGLREDREVVADSQEIAVRRRLLFFSRTQRLARSQIKDIQMKQNMSAGERRWFELQAIAEDRTSLTLASGVEEADAQWIIERINTQLRRS